MHVLASVLHSFVCLCVCIDIFSLSKPAGGRGGVLVHRVDCSSVSRRCATVVVQKQ